MHYFDNQEQQNLFSSEILEDELFSFFLLRKLFQKLVKRYDEQSYNEISWGSLDRLAKLRNLAAHAGLEGDASLTTPGSLKLTNLFFRHGGERKSIKDTIDVYNKLRDELQPKIEKINGYIS